MRRTRLVVLVLGVALAAFALAGCGGDDDEGATDTETTETETTDTGAATGGTKLIGTVGTEDDADAFTITLTTEDGSEVTSLAAGSYTLEIKDLSSIHNFHLTGPGGVDVSSEVGEIEDEDYDVTLEAGTYDFVCDPHAGSMKGSFEVTG